MDDEAIWKRRFLVSMLVRLCFLAIFIFGVAATVTDVLRPGGWPRVGALLAIVGAIGSVAGPLLVRKSWERG